MFKIYEVKVDPNVEVLQVHECMIGNMQAKQPACSQRHRDSMGPRHRPWNTLTEKHCLPAYKLLDRSFPFYLRLGTQGWPTSSSFSSCYKPRTIRSTSDNVAAQQSSTYLSNRERRLLSPVIPRNGARGGSSLDAHSLSTRNGDCYIFQHIRAASLLPSTLSNL